MPNQIIIPYHPLLKQITSLLNFPEPLYHIQDLSKNSAYVSMQTNIQKPNTSFLALTYVGGHAATIEESCEIAAKKAVQNISKKWGIVVEDLTFEKYNYLERCRCLYKLKCNELEDIIKGEDIQYQEEHVLAGHINVRHVVLNYMPLLKKIFRAVAIQCTSLETVRHCANRYTSWIILQPLFNNASREIFIGPSCDTLLTAKSYLAKKVITYLIPAYNLEIVDANYATCTSDFANVSCNFQLENYLSIRGRINGVLAEPAFSNLLIQRDVLAFETADSEIPQITQTSIEKNPKGTSRLASPQNVVVCQAGEWPVYYKIQSQQQSCSKRTRHS